jgi:hypothetical protein
LAGLQAMLAPDPTLDKDLAMKEQCRLMPAAIGSIIDINTMSALVRWLCRETQTVDHESTI